MIKNNKLSQKCLAVAVNFKWHVENDKNNVHSKKFAKTNKKQKRKNNNNKNDKTW